MPRRGTDVALLDSGLLTGPTSYRLIRTHSGRLDAVVSVDVRHSQSPALDGLVGFQYACYGDHLWLSFKGVPRIDGASAQVSWRVDNGRWRTETWDAAYRGIEVGWVVSPPDDFAMLRSLRSANRLALSVTSSPALSAMFDISKIFATPLQQRLEECANPLRDRVAAIDIRISARPAGADWIEFALQQRDADGGWQRRLLPPSRHMPPIRAERVGHWLVSGSVLIEPLTGAAANQPVRGLDGWTKEGVRFVSFVAASDDLVSHVIAVGGGGGPPRGELWLLLACEGGELSAVIGGWQTIGSRSVDVHWRIDDRETWRAQWAAGSYAELGNVVAPVGQVPFINALRTGDILHITLKGPRDLTGWIPLDGLFNTPAQPNLVGCGSYTARDALPAATALALGFQPLRGVSAEHPDSISYAAVTGRATGQLETSVWVWSEYSEAFGGVALLRINCSGGRLWLAVQGYAHVPDDLVSAVWSVDNGARVSEDWDAWFGSTRLGYTVSPQLDWQVIKRLRNARTFSIRILDEAVLTFLVSGLFSTPVQPNLDHCGLWLNESDEREPVNGELSE